MILNIFKQTLFTVLYTVTLFFVLWGVDILIKWGANIFFNLGVRIFKSSLFYWFVGQNLFIKILLFLVVVSTFIRVIFSIFRFLGAMVSVILSSIFSYNSVTVWISLIMCGLNALLTLIVFWPFNHSDFWSFVSWLILAFFVIQMNWLFLLRDLNPNSKSNKLYGFKGL